VACVRVGCCARACVVVALLLWVLHKCDV
jgi:hypothetical protein